MKKIVFLVLCIFFIHTNSSIAAPSSTPYNWGFKRGVNEQQADAGKNYNQILPKYNAIYKGDASKKVLYLTFDNGYENGYTVNVLDILKKTNVPATFFVTGHYLESAPDLVKRMVKEGHIIGNHSWGHYDYTVTSNQKIKRDLEKVKARTFELTGQKEMKYLRTPRGTFSEKVLDYTNKLGYKNVFWSVAYVDWITGQQKGPEFAYNAIMTQIHPGAIILLHSVSKDNAVILEKVITDLKNKGYTFKSLDEFK
ncbi:MAG: pdaA [Bacillales bacterium]|jgi:peptidoglycan-N-acetylmuramic acid deacetylase|nr:pdaA [Bacillales bacterium]